MKKRTKFLLNVVIILFCACESIDPPIPLPNSVTTSKGTYITFTSARLSAKVYGDIANGLTLGFNYGTDESVTSFATASMQEDGVFSAEIKGLIPGKRYYYQAVIKNKKEMVSGKTEQFITFPEGPVDFDLPSGLKWASCNVGASIPTDSGDYYSWGETESKKYYDWSTYQKFCPSGDYRQGLTKYISRIDTVVPYDGKEFLDAEDDVARVKLGGQWRMPTSSEFLELFQYCTSSSVTINGVHGYKFVSKKEMNEECFIFFPSAGYFKDGSTTGAGVFLWTSTLYEKGYNSQYAYYADSRTVSYNGYRSNGMPVRAICE